MKIIESRPDYMKICLDSDFKMHVKTIEIIEKVNGNVLSSLCKLIDFKQSQRMKENREGFNRIAMSGYLFMYLCHLARYQLYPLSIKSDITGRKGDCELMGLKIVIREDFDIDEIDIYRDITEEAANGFVRQ